MKYNIYSIIKKKIRTLTNTVVNIALFFVNTFIIIVSIKKISSCNVLIFQNQRIGFGNIFTSIDLARKMFKNKNILFINFYDASRFHNPKIFDFLNEEKIILFTSIYLKFRKSKFGEFDVYPKKNENYFQNLLISIIIRFSNSKVKKYNIPELYQLAVQKNKSINNKKFYFISPNHKWLSYYYFLVERNNKLRLNKNNRLLNQFNVSKKSKSICFYKREKKLINEITQNFELYFQLIKIFYEKKFTIYLTGEYSNFIKSFPEIRKYVNLPETNNIFDNEKNLAMQLSSNYYIGDAGGGSYFAMYKKKSIILGDHEGNFYTNNVKSFKYILYKNNRKIKTNIKFKKYLDQQIKTHKSSLDPFMLYKLGFTLKSYDNQKVIKYVKNNFFK